MAENSKIINKKSFSRFFAVQILFAYFFGDKENTDIGDLTKFIEEYYIAEEFSDVDFKEYKKNVNTDFLNQLLAGVIEHQERIDLMLNNGLEGKYTFNVVDDIIKIILRLAVYEFLYTDTDKKIIINEYVDIAGEYFDTKAVSFVNATIDKLSKIEK